MDYNCNDGDSFSNSEDGYYPAGCNNNGQRNGNTFQNGNDGSQEDDLFRHGNPNGGVHDDRNNDNGSADYDSGGCGGSAIYEDTNNNSYSVYGARDDRDDRHDEYGNGYPSAREDDGNQTADARQADDDFRYDNSMTNADNYVSGSRGDETVYEDTWVGDVGHGQNSNGFTCYDEYDDGSAAEDGNCDGYDGNSCSFYNQNCENHDDTVQNENSNKDHTLFGYETNGDCAVRDEQHGRGRGYDEFADDDNDGGGEDPLLDPRSALLVLGRVDFLEDDCGRGCAGSDVAAAAGARTGPPQRPVPDVMYMWTPCLHSLELSELAKRPVYLKLENCQATGSFSDRGVGNCVKQAYLRGHKRVMCVSAGNAGLSAAHAATALGMPCTVVVPSTTLNLVVSRLKREGADVMVHGENVKQSATFGAEMAAANNAFLAHPYDHPDIWQGNASIVDELKMQLPGPPGMIVSSVGGGGLLCGLLLGVENAGWTDKVGVVGVETEGTASFNASMKAGKVVKLSERDMKSIARSLAVSKPTSRLDKYIKNPLLFSEVVSDAQAAHAVLRFADDHRFLVEPSTGAALAFLYSGVIHHMMKRTPLPGGPESPVVVVVCGGTAVTLDLLDEWKRKYVTREDSGKR